MFDGFETMLEESRDSAFTFILIRKFCIVNALLCSFISPPTFFLSGKLTDKSDVYAFGVVLLELLLGRRPVEKLAPAQCQSIVTWVCLALVTQAVKSFLFFRCTRKNNPN